MKNCAAIAASLALGACATGSLSGLPAPFPAPSVNADVGGSRWGRPGEVELDLNSGRYWLTLAPPIGRDAPVEGPGVRQDRLPAEQLEALRTAAAAAVAHGLVEPVCAAGGRPPQIVVSTSGPAIMVLRSGRGTLGTHADFGCWTEAARTLHRVLELNFGREARGGR